MFFYFLLWLTNTLTAMSCTLIAAMLGRLSQVLLVLAIAESPMLTMLAFATLAYLFNLQYGARVAYLLGIQATRTVPVRQCESICEPVQARPQVDITRSLRRRTDRPILRPKGHNKLSISQRA